AAMTQHVFDREPRLAGAGGTDDRDQAAAPELAVERRQVVAPADEAGRARDDVALRMRPAQRMEQRTMAPARRRVGWKPRPRVRSLVAMTSFELVFAPRFRWLLTRRR